MSHKRIWKHRVINTPYRRQRHICISDRASVEKWRVPAVGARERGYIVVSPQQEVCTGYFDEVTTVIQGGKSSVTALTGSTEEEQFH